MLEPGPIVDNAVAIGEGEVICLVLLKTPINCALLFLAIRTISLVGEILIIKMLSLLKE